MASEDVKKLIEFSVKKNLVLKVKEKLRCHHCKTPKNPLSVQMYRCASPKCNRRFCEECAVFELDEICPFPSVKRNKDHNLIEDTESADLFWELWCELPDFCTFETYGCQEVLMRDVMKKHERECLYRNINCPDIDCDAIVNYMNLNDHFRQEHDECKEYESNEIRHDIAVGKKLLKSGYYWPPPRIWCLEQKQFFLVSTVQDDTLYSWVYYYDVAGDETVAQNIFYYLSIRSDFDDEGMGEEHYYSGQVRNLEEDPKEIMFKQNAFAIGTRAVQHFLNRNYELIFNLKICKAK